jgi:ABC-type sulfate transport system substrate-binding protein
MKIQSKTIINGVNADVVKALADDKEDYAKRQKADQDDKQSLPMSDFMALIDKLNGKNNASMAQNSLCERTNDGYFKCKD